MAEPFILHKRSYFLIEKWKKMNPKLIAGFTTKNDGFSLSHYKSQNLGLHVGDDRDTVVKNRNQLAESIQFPLSQWVCLEQTHGNSVQYVNEHHWGKGASNYSTSIKNCDGVYTDKIGTLLALMYADCVPIYFYAPKENFVGIVHAGWKGTVKEIVQTILVQWQELGIDIASIYACIGPSICKHCYIVDDNVIHEVEKMNIPNQTQFYKKVDTNQYQLDLKSLNKMLLTTCGVKEHQIDVTSFCTSCHHQVFFSHRREKGKTGRMMGFIGLKED